MAELLSGGDNKMGANWNVAILILPAWNWRQKEKNVQIALTPCNGSPDWQLGFCFPVGNGGVDQSGD